ncbi:unnamed protein product, partial [Didymodactylos carnosus]
MIVRHMQDNKIPVDPVVASANEDVMPSFTCHPTHDSASPSDRLMCSEARADHYRRRTKHHKYEKQFDGTRLCVWYGAEENDNIEGCQ